MYCPKCGAQLPDDAVFCMKCGTNIAAAQPKQPETQASASPVIAPQGATALACPNCGAPISPVFGEMVITCEYCGSSVMLAGEGWKRIQKQSMLEIKFAGRDKIVAEMHNLMDKGLLHRHLQEGSTLEEMSLSFVPYWIVSASARTSVVASDVAVEAGEAAASAAIIGLLGAGLAGGRRGRGFGGSFAEGAILGSAMTTRRGATKTYELDNNYNFPIVAVKALTQYQPRDYQFALQSRVLFDVSKIPKGTKILNGDVGEEAAKYQAKTLVDQLQSEKAHSKYHMIQQLHTETDIADTELLYAPIWLSQYDHKGNKIVLVIDANSGAVISSIGL